MEIIPKSAFGTRDPEALPPMEQQSAFESPALEAALLEGLHSRHRPYEAGTLDEIRRKSEAL